MPIICRFISDQTIATVCREDLPRGELIKRVVDEGMGTADQFEEIILSESDFRQAMIDYSESHPPPIKPPHTELPYVRTFAQKMIALGFTKRELKSAFLYGARLLEE